MKEKNGVHYFEVRDLITQFVSAFDSVIIGRFNKSRQKESEIRVRYVYAPKQKVLHDLVNKAQHITVPVIAVNMSAMARDESRVESKNLGHYVNSRQQNSYEIPQPVPVDISIQMSIITRYQDDLDQILANFIPYTNPYVIMSWKYPDEFTKNLGVELESKVVWDGNININQPIDMGEGEKYRNIAETTFIIKGWLFKKHPERSIGNIFEVHNNFYAINSFSDTLVSELSADSERIFQSSKEIDNKLYPNLLWLIYTLTYVPSSPIQISGGEVYEYTSNGDTVYRFVPSTYTYSGDIFYKYFDGVTLLNKIVSRN